MTSTLARTRSGRTRSARLAAARSWDGYRSAHFARDTGTLVVVVRDDDGGNGGDPENPWVTICDDHSTVCSHSSLSLARSHAADPLGWCETCRDLRLADDAQAWLDVADELNDVGSTMTVDDLDGAYLAAGERHARRHDLPWPPGVADLDRYYRHPSFDVLRDHR